MADIFWGFFLVFINFNLSFNAHTLNILPPFLGYLLLARGMESLAAESGLFSDIRPFALRMAVYTAVLWAGGPAGRGAAGNDCHTAGPDGTGGRVVCFLGGGERHSGSGGAAAG